MRLRSLPPLHGLLFVVLPPHKTCVAAMLPGVHHHTATAGEVLEAPGLLVLAGPPIDQVLRRPAATAVAQPPTAPRVR